MKSYSIAAGGYENRARGRTIKEPVNILWDASNEMEGVDPGMDASNTIVARSIK